MRQIKRRAQARTWQTGIRDSLIHVRKPKLMLMHCWASLVRLTSIANQRLIQSCEVCGQRICSLLHCRASMGKNSNWNGNRNKAKRVKSSNRSQRVEADKMFRTFYFFHFSFFIFFSQPHFIVALWQLQLLVAPAPAPTPAPSVPHSTLQRPLYRQHSKVPNPHTQSKKSPLCVSLQYFASWHVCLPRSRVSFRPEPSPTS